MDFSSGRWLVGRIVASAVVTRHRQIPVIQR
jgi:hypothetical protein